MYSYEGISRVTCSVFDYIKIYIGWILKYFLLFYYHYFLKDFLIEIPVGTTSNYLYSISDSHRKLTFSL